MSDRAAACPRCGAVPAERLASPNGSTDRTARKITKCRACGHEISRRAVTCPHCGHPNKSSPGQRLAFGCLAIVLGALSLFLLGLAALMH
jgi:DNA-directed RNA polymerase subunit RPC12/RpoP